MKLNNLRDNKLNKELFKKNANINLFLFWYHQKRSITQYTNKNTNKMERLIKLQKTK